MQLQKYRNRISHYKQGGKKHNVGSIDKNFESYFELNLFIKWIVSISDLMTNLTDDYF